MTPVVSSGLHHGDFDVCLRAAKGLDAKLIRLALTPILCGDRNAAGDEWPRLVANVRAKLADYAPRAAAAGRTIVIENHQDFTSHELVAFCDEFGPERAHRLRYRQQLSGRRSAARFHARDRAPCRARPSQGLSRAVDRRGLSAGALRHRRRRRAVQRVGRDPRRAPRDAAGRAGAGRAGGAACPPVHAGLVARLSAEGRRGAGGLPARGAAQPPARRRGLSHAVGAQGGPQARPVRTRHDPAQRREHAASRNHAGKGSDHDQGTERQDRVRHGLGPRPRARDGAQARRPRRRRRHPRSRLDRAGEIWRRPRSRRGRQRDRGARRAHGRRHRQHRRSGGRREDEGRHRSQARPGRAAGQLRRRRHRRGRRQAGAQQRARHPARRHPGADQQQSDRHDADVPDLRAVRW